MGQIDVTSILADPDMVDPMIIIRRAPLVDGFGENELQEQGFNTWGSVQPVSGKALQRIPEALRVANGMSFWVKGHIVADGQGRYSDVLVHKSIRYAVQHVFDWSAWGEGWCEGICVQEKPAR